MSVSKKLRNYCMANTQIFVFVCTHCTCCCLCHCICLLLIRPRPRQKNYRLQKKYVPHCNASLPLLHRRPYSSRDVPWRSHGLRRICACSSGGSPCPPGWFGQPCLNRSIGFLYRQVGLAIGNWQGSKQELGTEGEKWEKPSEIQNCSESHSLLNMGEQF